MTVRCVEETDLREMEATYETKQGVIDGYYNTISDYELNSVRLASGNAEEIAKTCAGTPYRVHRVWRNTSSKPSATPTMRRCCPAMEPCAAAGTSKWP